MIAATLAYDKRLDKEILTLIKSSKIDKKLNLSIKDITFYNFLADKILMICVIRHGVPYSLFDKIQNFTPFTENYWADLLDVSTKTLQRYRQDDKSFRPIQSEKIIEMAEVTKIGLEVFGDIDKLKLWLNTPSFALGKIKPIELLKDSYGKELVIGELTRINYGIFV
ncbi:antitoxin [Chitinophaga caeni]|uniref:Antitoxin n=1 Tax=Chitinophaga caeni TaxID=2029983 RepID=A0A291QWH4_9BACT|nr:antitoxin Xre-like helix-turn-helix domain-containing protein [Chitinophaga caeni]ATL48308.1 antitoxin [Chitinophaga caeni]